MTTTPVPDNEAEGEQFPIWTIVYVSIPILIIIAVIALVIYIRRAIRGRRAETNARLSGKTAIVTGSNTGIGKETARDFAERGARVIMACRNLDKANDAANDIRTHCPKANIVVMKLDLASFASIRKFANEILQNEQHIDILVNNAGLMYPKSKTEDGHDIMFGTNHLGTFLLTYLLLDRIKESAPARIVTVSSVGHTFVSGISWNDINYEKSTYSIMKVYSESKLANVLFSKELGRRLEGTGVTTYSLHPGAIKSDFFSQDLENAIGFFFRIFARIALAYFSKTPVQGAQTTIYCAVDESLKNKTGLYYSNCHEKTPSRAARDTASAIRLWEMSLQMVGIANDATIERKW